MAEEGTVIIDKQSMERLKRMPQLFQSNELMQGVMKILLKIEQQAKIHTPVDTGRLRASITSGKVTRGLKEIIGEVGTTGTVRQVAMSKRARRLISLPGTKVFYGPYVEYGTKYMAARPFLEPALNKVTSQYAGQYIKEAVEKAWNRLVK